MSAPLRAWDSCSHQNPRHKISFGQLHWPDRRSRVFNNNTRTFTHRDKNTTRQQEKTNMSEDKKAERKKPKTAKVIDFGVFVGKWELPDGVYGEILQGFMTHDVVKYTADELKEFLESKNAWELYLSCMEDVMNTKGFFGYSDKKVAETLMRHYNDFVQVGIKPFFCTKLVSNGQTATTYKWLVYCDTDVVAADYQPEQVHKGCGCSIM